MRWIFLSEMAKRNRHYREKENHLYVTGIVLLVSPFFAPFNFRPFSAATKPSFWGERKPGESHGRSLFSRE